MTGNAWLFCREGGGFDPLPKMSDPDMEMGQWVTIFGWVTRIMGHCQ